MTSLVLATETEVTVVSVGEVGPPGAPGSQGPAGPIGPAGPANLFVQNATPVGPPATYLWVQTGLGMSGTDMTFWVQDGLP